MHLLNTIKRIWTGAISTVDTAGFIILVMAFGGTFAMLFAYLGILLTKGSLSVALICGVVGLIAGADAVAEVLFKDKDDGKNTE